MTEKQTADIITYLGTICKKHNLNIVYLHLQKLDISNSDYIEIVKAISIETIFNYFSLDKNELKINKDNKKFVDAKICFINIAKKYLDIISPEICKLISDTFNIKNRQIRNYKININSINKNPLFDKKTHDLMKVTENIFIEKLVNEFNKNITNKQQ